MSDEKEIRVTAVDQNIYNYHRIRLPWRLLILGAIVCTRHQGVFSDFLVWGGTLDGYDQAGLAIVTVAVFFLAS
jgi:hypothetical protein